MRYVLFIFFLVLQASSLFAEKGIKLVYQLDHPLELVCAHTLDISQTIPGIDLVGRGEQSFVSEIKLEKLQQDQKKDNTLYSLVILPKSIRVDLTINQEKTSFDTREPGNSLFLAQLAKMMGKPITVKIDKNLNVDVEHRGVLEILQEFPALKDIEINFLLQNIIQPIFAVADTEIVVGSDLAPNPAGIHYEITEITDQKVKAIIRGNIPPFKKSFASIENADKKPMIPELSISGTVQGEAEWDRDNALLCRIKCDYKYNGLLKLFDWEWPLSLKLTADVGTREIPQ